jgi:hypothetical protein
MTSNPLDDWVQLKPDAELALAELLSQLQAASADSPNQDFLDSYLYAKRLMAEAMKAFIRIDLDERCETFHDLRAKLAEEMRRRYSGRVPDAYLTVPYGSRLHEELFTILLKRIGTTVPAALLRIVTADSVHTERRTRELRELGFDITSFSENSIDVYRLNSLEINTSMIPTLIANRAKGNKFRALSEAKFRAIFTESDLADLRHLA